MFIGSNKLFADYTFILPFLVQTWCLPIIKKKKRKKKNLEIDCTAIPYRVSTGPEQGFHSKFFPNREKPVFIKGIPANENRFFPVGKNLQGKPCFHYRDGFEV